MIDNTDNSEERMMKNLERIAGDLEKLLTATYWVAGLLAVIAFLITYRLMIGR